MASTIAYPAAVLFDAEQFNDQHGRDTTTVRSDLARLSELHAAGFDTAALTEVKVVVFRSDRGQVIHSTQECTQLRRTPYRLKLSVDTLIEAYPPSRRCSRCAHDGVFAQVEAALREAERLMALRDRCHELANSTSWAHLTELRHAATVEHRNAVHSNGAHPGLYEGAAEALEPLRRTVLEAAEGALATHEGVGRRTWSLGAAVWSAQPDPIWYSEQAPIIPYATGRARSGFGGVLRNGGTIDEAVAALLAEGLPNAIRGGASPQGADAALRALAAELIGLVESSADSDEDHVVLLPELPVEERVRHMAAPATPFLPEGPLGVCLLVVPPVVARWLANFDASLHGRHKVADPSWPKALDLGPVPRTALETVFEMACVLRRDGGAMAHFADAWSAAVAVAG